MLLYLVKTLDSIFHTIEIMEYTFWKYYCWSSCLPIILSHPHCQLTDGPSDVLGEGRGGGGCPSGKNVLGVHPKFWV